jgi:hypothetical protein
MGVIQRGERDCEGYGSLMKERGAAAPSTA